MEAMQSIQTGLAAVYTIIYGVAGFLTLGVYVICALSLYTMAKRRGISKPWLLGFRSVICGLWAACPTNISS